MDTQVSFLGKQSFCGASQDNARLAVIWSHLFICDKTCPQLLQLSRRMLPPFFHHHGEDEIITEFSFWGELFQTLLSWGIFSSQTGQDDQCCKVTQSIFLIIALKHNFGRTFIIILCYFIFTLHYILEENIELLTPLYLFYSWITFWIKIHLKNLTIWQNINK